jgi:predicted ATPase/class 3 adenylate cyclase
MPAPPTGTVTFLFTDIEGSTRLLHALGEGYRAAQDRHGEIVRTAVEANNGYVVRTEGDSFFVTFRTPIDAVRGAVTAQRQLSGNDWPEGVDFRVRMGLHTGLGVLAGDDYIGIDVNRAARIAAAAHGGQVLLSEATRVLIQHDLPDGVALRNQGEHRLKDITHSEHLFDLVVDGLPADFPPIWSFDVRPNNLPLQLTSFVGRADEIAQALQLLGDHRLVTLTGPGGSGKTRLALEVSSRVLPRFDDGVFFVDLAPLSDHAQVPSAITQALGMRDQQGRELIDTLVDGVATVDLLLVLDNFEHVLPGAWVAERLLGAAPKLRILATSRAPLRLYGEQELPVPPLALPDLDDAEQLTLLSRYEAIALFIERARAASPEFALSESNARVVAGICGRLDGLPLAIELAASRIKVLTPQAILSRLLAGPDLLTATPRNLPPRQRTLRATISWSHGLLAEPEQRLFARLSVFRGGASLEALEAVGNPEGDLGVDTLDGLTSLIDNSLVAKTEMRNGDLRFGMLETIREFAGELLAAEEDEAATRRRHADYFLALAHAGESHLTADDQVPWLNRFEYEHDNLQAAFQWTLEAEEPERGADAAAAMWRFWQQRGYLSVGRRWLEGLISSSGPNETATLAKAHLAAGSIAYYQGDNETTDQQYRKALAVFEAVGDPHGIAEAIYNLAFVPRPDAGWREARSARVAHVFAIKYGDTVSEEVPVPGAGSLDNDTEWRIGHGNIDALRDAMNRFEALGDLAGVAKAKGNMALFLGGLGDHQAAVPLLEEAIASYRELHDRFHLVHALAAYGQGKQQLGDPAAARAAIVEALSLVDEADNSLGTGVVLEILSGLESAQGQHERAVRLFGSGREIQRRLEGGLAMAATDVVGIDVIAVARQAIGDQAVDRALAEGRSMSRADAVAYARDDG